VCSSDLGIAVALHAGDHGYGKYAAAWERRGSMEAFRGYAFGSATQAGRAIFDALAALVIHGLFQRHPRLRIYSVENGSEWAPLLLQRLVKCQGQFPNLFREPALDTFRRHVSIAPYYEDDIRDLADRIGCENVIMGSDWPHAEGLADPLRFVDELEQFSGGEVRSIMHDSPWSLVTPLDGDLA
jgi:predicted TIM-barrel fold metal-dependent hydrolase